VEITAGPNHTCARRAGGAVLCWGANEAGQVGDGTFEARSSPVPVDLGQPAESVVAGKYGNTCAVLADRTARCWGENYGGQLGDGTSTLQGEGVPTPVVVHGLGEVAALALGQRHACAMTLAGEVWCWGRGAESQLGIGTTPSRRTTPERVVALQAASAIAAGTVFTCACADGSVWCWGRNGDRQLADGTTEERSLPTRSQVACP
jgi:alpha-tubulin suppressor-like RCC1 family protein